MAVPRSFSLVATGVAATLVLVAVLGAFVRARPAPVERPPAAVPEGDARVVVMISLDTLRQDHLSLYGYPRPTSPCLEELARDAVTFTNAMSQAPYTLPSHMSMMTGLHPRAHGVRYFDHSLADGYVTLAETLRSAGLRTVAFTDGGLMSRQFGFAQGFEHYDDGRRPGAALANGFRRYGSKVHEWLERARLDRFFLFLHTFDTHGPYEFEPEWKEALAGTEPVVPEAASRLGDPMAYLRSLRIHEYFQLDRYDSLAEIIDDYDASIRFVDAQVGALMGKLKELGLYDDAMIVVTSDHGESFLDHDLYMGHGLTLYEEEVRVPLIVKYPRGRFAGRRCDAIVRLIDIYPTIANAVGADVQPEVEGVDLTLAVTGEDPEPRVAFGVSPNFAAPGVEGVAGITAYVRRENWKYIDPPRLDLGMLVAKHLHRPKEGEPGYDLAADPLHLRDRLVFEPQLFDLDRDPHERENRAAEQRRQVEAIQARIERKESECLTVRRLMQQAVGSEAPLLSTQEIRELHQQGYISFEQMEQMIREAELRAEQKARAAAAAAPCARKGCGCAAAETPFEKDGLRFCEAACAADPDLEAPCSCAAVKSP